MASEKPQLKLQDIRNRLHSAGAHGKMIGRYSIEAAHLSDRHYLDKRLTLAGLREKVESARKHVEQATEDLDQALRLLMEGMEE